MAEFAAAALTAITATLGTAGAAAGATAAVAAPEAISAAAISGATAGGAAATAGATSGIFASLGTASTVASILSGTATAASVLGTMAAGSQKADMLEMQATDAEVGVSRQVVEGLQARASLRQQLTDTLGKQLVQTAAAGADTSFGTPATARRQAAVDSERAVDVNEDVTRSNVSALYERAALLRQSADAARKGSLFSAAATALGGAAKTYNRG